MTFTDDVLKLRDLCLRRDMLLSENDKRIRKIFNLSFKVMKFGCDYHAIAELCDAKKSFKKECNEYVSVEYDIANVMYKIQQLENKMKGNLR